MKPITQTYRIKASPTEVFRALTDAKAIEQWSGAPATMSPELGVPFSVFDEWLTGENTEIITNEKIVQDWRCVEFEGKTRVTFTLTPDGDETIVELIHEHVPEESYESIAQGWKDCYMDLIQEMLEED